MSDPKARRTIVINKPEGLHARPAELFAKLASEFNATIHLIKDDKRVDAKSILDILTLAATQGTELTLEAVGHDAIEAIDALVELVESDFAVDGPINQQPSG